MKNQTKNAIKKLESLSVIYSEFNLWSGQRKLEKSDINIGNGKLPPEKVASLGNKLLIDSEKLRPFNRLKTACRRQLLSYGMPFMNGVAIPSSKADEVCRYLETVNAEFEQIKFDFLRDYEASFEEWCKENPEFEFQIRGGKIAVSEIEHRYGYNYGLYMINPVSTGDIDFDNNQADSLGNQVNELGDSLVDTIAKESKAFWNQYFAGKTSVNTSTKSTLTNLRDKIDGLSFLNGSFSLLVDLIDDAIKCYSVSHKKYTSGIHFSTISNAVLLLSDKSNIELYGSGKLTAKEHADQTSHNYVGDFSFAEEKINPKQNAGGNVDEIAVSNNATSDDVEVEDKLKQENVNPDVTQTTVSNNVSFDDIELDDSLFDMDLSDIDDFFETDTLVPETLEAENKQLSNEPETLDSSLIVKATKESQELSVTAEIKQNPEDDAYF